MLLYFLLTPAILVLAAVASWYYIYFSYRRYLQNFKEIKGYPLIGSLLHLKPVQDLYHVLKRLHRQHGQTFWGMGAFDPYLLTVDPKLVKVILSSTVNITKAKFYDMFKVVTGHGLVTINGDLWRSHRRILNPAFYVKMLKSYCDVFDGASDILIKQMEKQIDTKADVSLLIDLCVLDFVSETNLGESVNAQVNGGSVVYTCLKVLTKVVLEKIIKPMENNFVTYYFTNNYKVESENRKRFIRFFEDLLQRHVVTSNDNVLTLLLEANICRDVLIDELRMFIIAGYETVANTTNFALHLLAENPEIQSKSLAEIDVIFGNDRKRPITFGDLQSMKYLEFVVKETLRMYAAGPIIGRKLEEEVLFEGEILPKGLNVLIPLYVLLQGQGHDPEEFKPERFSTECDEGGGLTCYIPFSIGPRNCIGQKYAMFAIKTILAKILMNFELKAVGHEMDLGIYVTLKSRNGVVVQLNRRIS